MSGQPTEEQLATLKAVARGLASLQPALKHLREPWRLGDAERLALRAAHALRPLAARVFELADGTRSVEEISLRQTTFGIEFSSAE